jgi:3-oxoacyl-[acyl-carrier protein] reductase
MPVALIPGGTRGIGRGVAEALLARGWDVCVASRTGGDPGLGPRCLVLKADCSDEKQVRQLLDTCRQRLGVPDALVHAAGTYHRVPLLQETARGFREQLEHNLTSFFLVAQGVAPWMQERGSGCVVAFGVAGMDRLVGQPQVTAHVVAKTGLLVLVKSLARVLGPHGVTVNCVSPGFVDSGGVEQGALEPMVPSIPAGRLGAVDDVVGAVLFLLGGEARYVNGANLVVDGGWGA